MKFPKSNFLIRFSIFMFFSFAGNTMSGQSTQSLYWEPEVSFDISTESRWAYSFGIGNRTLFYTKEDGEVVVDQNQEHLELSHFTGYRAGANTTIALGVLYRFAELFNEGEYDELRITQQLKYSHDNNLNLAHRFRLEEIFEEFLEIRSRYQISIARQLTSDFELGVGTETLYSLGARMKPELDQRISIELGNSSFENIEFSIELEYQYDNYLNTPEGDLFIKSGVAFAL